MPGWDDPISIVEDLDPEPQQPPGRFQLRDLVLGLLLLVGVLGFAGWQWWSQDMRQSSYSRAVDALNRNDLDQARAFFGGASGYRDADSRARDLDQRIALRDSLYMSATTQISAGNWAVALAGLRELRAIQPNFRDSAELERSTVANLAGQILDGSVALRMPLEGPPGLYYRLAARWVYVPDSDFQSRVRGNGTASYLVYDAPVAHDQPSVRHVLLADFTGAAPVTTTLPFDLEDYQDFRWNDKGVWAFRYGRYSTPGRAPVVNAMHGVEADYMPFGGTATYTISFDNTGGAMGEVLVDVDGTSDRYLMASWTGAQQWSSGILSNTIISLSVGSAGGGNHMVYATRGVGIDSARLSRDGRYALVTTFAPSSTGQVYRLLLLDLVNGGEPQLLDRVVTRSYDGQGLPTRWIASTFIESGAFAGMVLATVFNYDHTHVRLFDPVAPEEPLLDVEVPTTTGLMWAVSRADDRGLVVSGALSGYSPPYGPGDTQTQPVVEISRQLEVTQTGVLVDKHSYPYSVDPAPDHVAIVSVAGNDGDTNWTVYSVPSGSLGQSFVRPTVVYTQAVTSAVGLYDIAPVNAGDGLLTYVWNYTLRVRTYDGVVDVPLEEGIRAVYPHRYLHDRYPVLR